MAKFWELASQIRIITSMLLVKEPMWLFIKSFA